MDLYDSTDLRYRLVPEDFQWILNPDYAFERALYEFEFDYQYYSHRGLSYYHIKVPERKHNAERYPFGTPYKRNRSGYADPVYDSVKENLKIGWSIAIGDRHRWDSHCHPFWVDENGDLQCNNHYYHSWYTSGVLSAYEDAVHRRGGVKCAPTQKIQYGYGSPPVEQHAQAAKAGKTINSAAAGRLLAAGGVYNGNVEGYAEVAKQLGGDAAKGYEQVYNQQTAGMWLAAVSLVGAKKMASMKELSEMKDFLGKYKQEPVFLKDVNISKLNYLRRDREELTALRKQFDSTVRKDFMKSISDHPEIQKYGFADSDLTKMARGGVPAGFNVHHKIPLDDGGTNSFDNLVLIQNDPFHGALTNFQRTVTKDLGIGESKVVLWPSPKGIIYPPKP